MKAFAQYKREEPDTILGEKITIITTYSSFDKEEIDEIEQYCKENIGNGLFADIREEDN